MRLRGIVAVVLAAGVSAAGGTSGALWYHDHREHEACTRLIATGQRHLDASKRLRDTASVATAPSLPPLPPASEADTGLGAAVERLEYARVTSERTRLNEAAQVKQRNDAAAEKRIALHLVVDHPACFTPEVVATAEERLGR